MLLDVGKEEIIKYLNENYGIILSYGNDDLIPVGQFVVNDILTDNIDEKGSETKFGISQASKVVLTKIDDEKVQIIMPLRSFINANKKLGIKNSEMLGLGYDTVKTVENIENDAKLMILMDRTFENLTKAETMPLTECDAVYMIDGQRQADNYSICPINLGKHEELVRTKGKEEGEEKNGYDRQGDRDDH